MTPEYGFRIGGVLIGDSLVAGPYCRLVLWGFVTRDALFGMPY